MTNADTLFSGGAPKNPATKTTDRDFPVDVPRDRWKRPLIVSPDGSARVAYTRASTLGGTLEDQYNLGLWRARMVARGVALRRDLALQAQSLRTADAPEDKKALDQIAERALEAAEASSKATIGTALHAITDRFDSGEHVEDLGEFQATLDAYAGLAAGFTMHQIEQFVVCDELASAGTFDRLVSPKRGLVAPDGTVFGPGERLVWDLKTSATADYFGIKFAVQLAVYAYGVPYSHEHGRSAWQVAPNRFWALICHAPSGGATAALHWVDLAAGWELAQLACTVRDWRKNKTLVRPAIEVPKPRRATPAPPGSAPETVGARLQLISALRRAPSRDAMVEIRRQAVERNAWSPELDDIARARVRELSSS
jgi:putative intracellular protease/amidase